MSWTCGSVRGQGNVYRILRWKRTVGTRLLGRKMGRLEDKYQRELLSSSCEKSRCVDLA